MNNDETAPLLAPEIDPERAHPHNQYDPETPLPSSPSSSTGGKIRDAFTHLLPQWTPLQRRVFLVSAFLMLSLNFGAYIGTPPELQIIEDIICKNHLLQEIDPNIDFSHGVPEQYESVCKSAAVQGELAIVNGWKYTFSVLPSIAFALPYGVLADKVGRKPVVVMALFSVAVSEVWSRIVCWFNLPIRTLWFAGIFQIPGGELMAVSVLLTITADVFSAEQRSNTLFQLSAMTFLAEMIATPLSAWMMRSGPWTPYILGSVIMMVGAAFSFLMPETLEHTLAKHARQEEEEQSNGDSFEDNLRDAEECAGKSSDSSLLDTVVSRAQEFVSSSRFIWTQPRILIAIVAVFAGSMDRASWYLLIQYISTKLSWSISQASFLISLRGLMALATLVVIIPVFSSFLARYLGYEAVKRDLCIARISAASGVLGYFLIFAASSAPSFVVGLLFTTISAPFVWSVISVATSFVTSQNQVATLYAAMSVSRSIGNITSGPVFASLYAFGMRLGLEWSGLPFAVASLVLLLTLIPLTCMRVHA